MSFIAKRLSKVLELIMSLLKTFKHILASQHEQFFLILLLFVIYDWLLLVALYISGSIILLLLRGRILLLFFSCAITSVAFIRRHDDFLITTVCGLLLILILVRIVHRFDYITYIAISISSLNWNHYWFLCIFFCYWVGLSSVLLSSVLL